MALVTTAAGSTSDSYISIADADTYVGKHFISTDTKRITWEGTGDSDKEILLRQSACVIDKFGYYGLKYDEDQTLEFPRDGIFYGYEDLGEIPEDVKSAQVEIAVHLLTAKNTRRELQMQGVGSVSIGGVSESFTGGGKSMPWEVNSTAYDLLCPLFRGVIHLI